MQEAVRTRSRAVAPRGNAAGGHESGKGAHHAGGVVGSRNDEQHETLRELG